MTESINIKDKKISVIVPVYNMEQYLRQTIDSIINQSHKNLEIICVNDGSTDSSEDIIKEYASRDDRVLLVNKANGGLSSARNAGLEVTTSDYVAFVDADDWVEPQTYETMLTALLQNDVDMVSCRFKREYEDFSHRKESDEFYDNKSAWPEGKHEVTNSLISYFSVFAWTKLYKTSIIKENKIEFPEGLIFEDWVFYWKYIVLADSVYSLDKSFYHYRQRANSIMASIYESDGAGINIIDYLKTAEVVYEYLNKKGLFDKYIKSFAAYYTMIYDNAHYFIKDEYKNTVENIARDFIAKTNLLNYQTQMDSEHYQYLRKIVDTSL